jgi:hypothetical protein
VGGWREFFLSVNTMGKRIIMRGAFLLCWIYRHISHEKPLPASAGSLFLFLRHTTPIRWQTPIRCILDLGEMKESLGVIMYEFLFSCWKLDRVGTVQDSSSK